MDRPTLVGRHRFKCDRAPGGGHPLPYAVREVRQGLVAPLLVSCDVQKDSRPFSQLGTGDEIDDELERPERFSLTPYEQARVIAVYVEHRPSQVGPLRVSQSRCDRDPHFGYEFVEDTRSDLHHIRGSFQERDADAGGFATDAENPCFAPANDVDLDFPGVCAELF